MLSDEISRDNYSPLKVANLAALLERLGSDCLPDQACREFTQNAVQSIEQRFKNTDLSEGLVVWTKFPWGSNKPGAPKKVDKLCIIDTGEGMTGPEMVMYLNQLSCSGTGRGASNFGIGAKITGLIRSSHGVIYVSYKNGKGEAVAMNKTSDNNYGLFRDKLGREVFSSEVVGPMPNEIKTVGKGTGTMVIFLGDRPGQNTLNLFGDAGTAIIRYLNDRYHTFPKGITLRSKIDKGTGGRIRGTKFFLDQASIAKGTVMLPDTRAVGHWWVLGDTKPEMPVPHPFNKKEEDGSFTVMKSFSKYYKMTAHTAYLFENELYENQSGNSSTVRVQRCGIPLNTHRMVIYFEPLDSRVGSNSSRQALQLKQDGEGATGTSVALDWTAFADEFKQRMPAELKAALETLDYGVDHKGKDEATTRRLREVVGLFIPLKKVLRAAYKEAKGKVTLNPNKKLGEPGLSNTARRGPRREEPKPPGTGPGRPRVDPESDFSKAVYETLEDGEEGELGTAVEMQDLTEVKEPEVSWVSCSEKYKRPGDSERGEDQMHDRAAQYDSFNGYLLINRDFRVYQAWIELYAQQYPSTAQAREVIQSIVDQWWTLALKECVMLHAINRELYRWEINPSEATLTAVVLSRYHLQINLKREIHQKLGKPERNLDEATTMDKEMKAAAPPQKAEPVQNPSV